jgi:hypothetical protein
MALKPDRVEHLTDLSFFMNETATRGKICVFSTAGSGAAMDDSNAKVIVATGSGNAAGMLLNDVVNLDLTRQHINFHKDEVQKGGKVLLLRRGTVVTNNIESGKTPTAGNIAYFDSAGDLTTDVDSTPVGQFLSSKDADGYAKVEINIIPNV